MISVCMATHNGEKYIKEQVDSIISQLSQDDELVISDDGSTDSTLAILNSYQDKRIKIYHYSQQTICKYQHLYVTKNFENALSHAVGDYIFLSDQDDIWLPTKVNDCMKELKEGNLLVVTDMQYVENQQLIGGGYQGTFKWHNFLQMSPTYYGCVMAFNSSLLKYALPFPKRLLVHDFWLGIIAELKGNVKFINKKEILYRFHADNTSKNINTTLRYKISYRIYTLFHLLLRLIR